MHEFIIFNLMSVSIWYWASIDLILYKCTNFPKSSFISLIIHFELYMDLFKGLLHIATCITRHARSELV